MFISLQKAAQRCGRRLHFVMAGWFPGGETDHSRYLEAARRMSPMCLFTFSMAKILMLFAAVGQLQISFVVSR